MEHSYDYHGGADLNVFHIEVNREQSAFLVATESGFRGYDTKDCLPFLDQTFDHALQFATCAANTCLFAVMGRSRTDHDFISRYRVSLWNLATDTFFFSIHQAGAKPLRVLLDSDAKFFAPVCEDSVALLRVMSKNEFDKTKLCVAAWNTYSNPNAAAVLGRKFLVIPGISQGKLQCVVLSNLKSAIINAHNSALRAIALSQDEVYIATCSVTGTLVRIWSTKDMSKVAEYRRGIEECDIFSLAFSPDNAFLALTSDKGTLHIFELPFGPPTPTVSSPPASSVSHSRQPSDPRRRISESSTTSKSIPIPSRHRSTASNQTNNPDRHSTSPGSALKNAIQTIDLSPSRSLASPDRGTKTPPIEPRDSVSNAGSPRATSFAAQHAAVHASRRGRKPSTSAITPSAPKVTRFSADLPTTASASRGRSPGLESGLLGEDDYQLQSAYSSSSARTMTRSPPPATTSSSSSGPKYGALATLPFMPRLVRDTYSVANIPFYLSGVSSQNLHPTKIASEQASSGPSSIEASSRAGGQPTSSRMAASASSSSRASANIPSAPVGAPLAQKRKAGTRGTLAAGDPVVGQLAWVDASTVLVISAKRGGGHRGGLWERFKVERRQDGEAMLRFDGWRPCPGPVWEKVKLAEEKRKGGDRDDDDDE